ncbi:hypothetical protein PSN45_000809 [Yamadazyma tenuis]|uniref:Uncharacterized protein n=1 Tax=Candida tenuis (strain ATCC 10573 / BCRC 21748 / CBS 615 / JCM 9827 / NBRC 10315 / NRRL Y-1498 / VKM Y-70) TaxID=590646 RepID=G3BAS4_CANTC|nr:uncharacterized protein CANTEDRAFT_94983 [Yamadazyma tenuis ATCC 10573]EGV62098.1 hypothetical protein CANTEDRAFT_94983 [Yamadazyma tenuis ATCC 10573]WEJ93346.1 hypothetical protein PSN45_000809 [Yamadazyma tenuis]
MDAGTAAYTNKTRSPNTHRGDFGNNPVASHQQMYQSQYTSTNDLISPNFSMTSQSHMPGSRKASMTSVSAMSMNKLFRRNKGVDGGMAQFDEEKGADIQDLTGSVSFDDISHIRDRGPYGMTGTKTLDTTPIIPMVSTGGSSKNNIQYRKQMNHQMKMHLTNGARAMSLAGGNPMSNQNQDPRAMSFNSFSNGNPPRTMSMGMPQGSSTPNGPRAMSLRTGNPMQGYMPSGVPIHMNQMQMGMNPNMPRSMSMTNQNPMMNGVPMHGQMNARIPMNGMPTTNSQMVNGQSYGQPMMNGQMMSGQMMNGQMMSGQMMNGQMMNGQMYGQPMMNGYPMNGHPNGQMNSQIYVQGGNLSTPDNHNSSDSLMNVVEEREEEDQHTLNDVNSQTSKSRRIPPPLALEENEDDDDMVYKFDNEEDTDAFSLSRKSTLKKSNSMRLRKLNLFNNNDIEEETLPNTPTNSSPLNGYVNSNETSPSFNIRQSREMDVLSKSGSDEINKHLYGNQDKFNQLGATAVNESTSSDVYYTANDLNSPTKNLPSPNIRDSFTSKDSGKSASLQNTSTPEDSNKTIDVDLTSDIDTENEDDDTWNGTSSPKPISKQQSIRSLTENTAFHNFRSASFGKSSQLSNQVENVQIKSNDSSVKSSSSASKENYQTNPSTANTSSVNIEKAEIEKADMKNITDSTLVESPGNESIEIKTSEVVGAKEKRGSRINIFKRLSKSKRGSIAEDEDSFHESSARSSKRNSLTSTPTSSRRNSARRISLQAPPPVINPTPVKFTKEELGIMTANNDLLNELELVTTELASSIRRELKLESQIRKPSQGNSQGTASGVLEKEIREKSKALSDLQDKLTKERRLRFISEEHALLMEHGQTPSPLKLNYEKTELHRQLILKNDLCNQLQDKLNEYQSREDEISNQQMTTKEDTNLLNRYNELLKENAELKLSVVPELEKRLATLETNSQNLSPNRSPNLSPTHLPKNQRVLSLVQNSSFTSFNDSYNEDMNQSEDQFEINSLKKQRDDLREVVTKLNSSHSYEMKLASEKLKMLESRLKEQMSMNEKLRERYGNSSIASSSLNAKGGKLQGFTIVSPTKSLFDD